MIKITITNTSSTLLALYIPTLDGKGMDLRLPAGDHVFWNFALEEQADSFLRLIEDALEGYLKSGSVRILREEVTGESSEEQSNVEDQPKESTTESAPSETVIEVNEDLSVQSEGNIGVKGRRKRRKTELKND